MHCTNTVLVRDKDGRENEGKSRKNSSQKTVARPRKQDHDEIKVKLLGKTTH